MIPARRARGSRWGVTRFAVLSLCLTMVIVWLGGNPASGATEARTLMRHGAISVDEIDDPDGHATSILTRVFGSRFSGTWVNRQTDGRRQIGLVNPVSADVGVAYGALSAEGADLVAEGVDIVGMVRSLAELEALRDTAVDLARRAGVINMIIGVNVVENIVDGGIDVGSWDAERLGPLRELIAESGGALVLEPARFDALAQPANWPVVCLVRLGYQVFLGRSPTEADEEAWARILEARVMRPGGPAVVAPFFELLVGSDEWLATTVSGLYQQALDRSPEVTGRAFWTSQLRRGMRVHKVASFVFGSSEFHVRAGGTDEDFVTALYERILRRPPDSAGLAYWVSQVQATGTDRVAARFFESLESRSARVVALYERVLGRNPEPHGSAYWSERMLLLDDVRVAASLATSTEFIYRSGVTCDPPVEVVLLH